MRHFNFLASLCSWAAWFESHFVQNPEDRFSRVLALIIVIVYHFFHSKKVTEQTGILVERIKISLYNPRDQRLSCLPISLHHQVASYKPAIYTEDFNIFIIVIHHNSEEVSENIASLTSSTTITQPPIQLLHCIYQFDFCVSKFLEHNLVIMQCYLMRHLLNFSILILVLRG